MTRSAATTGARRRANAQTLPLTLCQTRRLTACLLVALAACNGDRTVAPDQARSSS